MRKKFIEILQTPIDDQTTYDIETKTRAAKLGCAIEDCLNSKFVERKSYFDKVRSLIFNLKDPKNPNLRLRILEADLTPWDLVTMEPKELASSDIKEKREQQLKANLDERRSDW